MRKSKGKKKRRARKKELVVPNCRENCQVNHSIDQIAALCNISPHHVRLLIKDGTFKAIDFTRSKGKKRKTLRIPHPEIYRLTAPKDPV